MSAEARETAARPSRANGESGPSKGWAVVSSPEGARGSGDDDQLGKAVDLDHLKRLWPYVKPHSRMLVLSMVLLPVVSLFVIARPRIMKWALDEGAIKGNVHVIDVAAVAYLVVVAAEYFGRFAQMYAMQLAGARAMGDLRLDVFRFLQRTKLAYFDGQPVGRIVTRVTNDVDALAELFASGALNAIGDLLSLVLIVVMMISLDWRLASIAMLGLPPLALAANWIRRRARDAFREIRGRTARLNAYLGEQVNGVAVTQAYGRERAVQAEFEGENDAFRDANYRAILYDALLDALVEGFSILSAALILWFAGFRGASLGVGIVSFGTFVAFMQYLEQFFIPIRDLAARYTLLQSAMAGAERVFKLLDTEGIEDAPVPGEGPGGAGLEVAPDGDAALAIEFEDVRFSYKKGSPALRGISLSARRGERVAIVGATGAGKSTIASLVLRLYERDSGALRVEGRDVRAWDRRALRQRFAVVPQDVLLFAGPIASNVALGEDEPDLARVEEALRRVDALDLFLARPGGLDAKVGDRGGGLSTGERQLVAFARALYRDPPMLILDEATASIDSDTERRLQKALHAVIEGRTSLVIAHRLSTIREADRVVVLHQGRVAETGTHEELLAHEGIYAKLYRLQFAREEHAGE
jgi:ATP-binding cassette subfamily B protein